jgi:hypothetical protein
VLKYVETFFFCFRKYNSLKVKKIYETTPIKRNPYKKVKMLVMTSCFICVPCTFPNIHFRMLSENVIRVKIMALRMPIFIIRERGFIFFALMKSNI